MADADCHGDSERRQCKCCKRRRRNWLRIRGSIQSRIQEDDGDPAFNLAAPRWSWLVALTIERNWLAANRWIRRDVRFGSLADILCSGSHVRFAPESRHLQRTNSCPLSANSGHLLTHEVRSVARNCDGRASTEQLFAVWLSRAWNLSAVVTQQRSGNVCSGP